MTYREQMEKCSIVNQCKASDALGIHRNTMRRELRKHGLTFERIQRLVEEKNPVVRAKLEMRRKKRDRLHYNLLKKPVVSIGFEALYGERSA